MPSFVFVLSFFVGRTATPNKKKTQYSSMMTTTKECNNNALLSKTMFWFCLAAAIIIMVICMASGSNVENGDNADDIDLPFAREYIWDYTPNIKLPTSLDESLKMQSEILEQIHSRVPEVQHALVVIYRGPINARLAYLREHYYARRVKWHAHYNYSAEAVAAVHAKYDLLDESAKSNEIDSYHKEFYWIDYHGKCIRLLYTCWIYEGRVPCIH